MCSGEICYVLLLPLLLMVLLPFFHDDRLLFKKWATDTPHNFRFTIKLPKHIIEDTYKVADFLEELAPLEEKVLAVIIESPPPIKLTLANGGRISRVAVAFEFNHSSCSAVGYGDYYPVTAVGWIIAVLVMFSGYNKISLYFAASIFPRNS